MRFTSECILSHNCLNEVGILTRRYANGLRPFVVADINTHAVCGKLVQSYLERDGLEPYAPFLLTGNAIILANMSNVSLIQNAVPDDAVIVAVGSGTINDLCKLASMNLDKPYIVVATAPSVDGYNSFGSAILVNGYKKTIPCDPPVAVLADSEILITAPDTLLSSGYGDLYAKIPAGADWIVADELGIQPIRQDVWDMVQPDLKRILSNPGAYIQKESDIVLDVFRGLLDSGMAIQKLMDSRPASGAEHLFSHTLEMENLCHQNGEPVLHGHKVALGTLVSTAYYEVFLRIPENELLYTITKPRESWNDRQWLVKQYFGSSPLLSDVLENSRRKFQSVAFPSIAAKLSSIKRRVQGQLVPFETIKEAFATVGCPTVPEQINLSREHMEKVLHMMQMIRARYTILDLLYDLGMYDTCTKQVMDYFP